MTVLHVLCSLGPHREKAAGIRDGHHLFPSVMAVEDSGLTAKKLQENNHREVFLDSSGEIVLETKVLSSYTSILGDM